MKTPWSKKVPFLSKYWIKRGIPEYRRVMIQNISQLLVENPQWKLLDVGCGTGLMFKYLPEFAKENYFGLDFTPEMIEYCKKQYPEYSEKFLRANVLEADIVPYSDIITTQNVLQHILLFQHALKNIIKKTTHVLLLCERTQKEPTIIFDYNPVRWRFKEKDILECLTFYGNKYGFSKPIIIANPKSTENIENILSIFKMVKKGDVE